MTFIMFLRKITQIYKKLRKKLKKINNNCLDIIKIHIFVP
jgi:hypothetical protein